MIGPKRSSLFHIGYAGNLFSEIYETMELCGTLRLGNKFQNFMTRCFGALRDIQLRMYRYTPKKHFCVTLTLVCPSF